MYLTVLDYGGISVQHFLVDCVVGTVEYRDTRDNVERTVDDCRSRQENESGKRMNNTARCHGDVEFGKTNVKRFPNKSSQFAVSCV